jgi:glucokinase
VLATGPAMAAWFKSQAPAHRRFEQEPGAKEIFQLAKEGDALAQEAVAREAYYLGLGLANLINLFVPEMIVLGGSVMKSAPLFLDAVRKVIAQGCRFVPFEKTELSLASLGEDANLIGAARVWHHRFGPGASQTF